MFPAESYSSVLGYFPQLLGFVYLLAFLSLLVQVRSLYGSRGILPIRELVSGLRGYKGFKGFVRIPSIFWCNSGDAVITASAGLGTCLSLYLMAGLPPLPALSLLWLLYLSFASMGQEFLSYQWDALLLETGFMTMFLPLADPAGGVSLPFFRCCDETCHRQVVGEGGNRQERTDDSRGGKSIIGK